MGTGASLPHSAWDLSSPTRYGTLISHIGRQIRVFVFKVNSLLKILIFHYVFDCAGFWVSVAAGAFLQLR